MKKLLLAIYLLINAPIVFADAQQEVEEAIFSHATDTTMDLVLERYKSYYDPQSEATFSIVGYDGLEEVQNKNNIVIYKVTLLFGDPDIPRIYKTCEISITSNNGKTTYSKINPRKCE